MVGVHTHASDARIIKKKRAMTKLKELAKNTHETTRSVISNAIQGLDKPTLASLPNQKSLVKLVERVRNTTTDPKNPGTLREINLTDQYRTTINGEKFLLFNSAEGVDDEDDEENDAVVKNRILIFSTAANLKFMLKCDYIYMDGTFKVVPTIFQQLYTIHGKFSNMLTLWFCLSNEHGLYLWTFSSSFIAH